MRHRIRALEERLKLQAQVVSKVAIPNSFDNFESWCRKHLSGSVEVHNRAIQAAEKSRFEDIELIDRALLLLRDGYVPMKREGGLQKKEQFERQCGELGVSEEADILRQPLGWRRRYV